MSFSRFSLLAFASAALFVSCGDNTGNKNDSLPGKDTLDHSTVHSTPDSIIMPEITVEVFDSAYGVNGWGYDLYVDGKRTIHQPLIPAVPGNDPFATYDDAKKTGELAVYKMQKTGSFPTITIHDLDSLGIKHQ